MFDKLTIRFQIMGTFAIFAVIIISVITSLAVVNLENISTNSEEIATSSLETQFIDDLTLVSVENSLVIKGKLIRAETVINTLTAAAEQLFLPSSPFQYRISTFDYDQSNIPNITINPRLNTNTSFTTSSYYFPFSFPSNVTSLTTSAMNDTISRSFHLNHMFESLYKDNNEFAWLNAAFEEGQVLRRYPGSVVNATRNFNHSTTKWYSDIKVGAAVSDNKIKYSAPFFDLTTEEWMIKLSKAIFDNNNQFIGVISGDLFLESLQIQTETTYKVTVSSYAILMLSDGQVISHPKWNKSNNQLDNIFNIEGLSSIHLAIIVSKDNGTIKYKQENVDEDNILAHTSILEKFYLLLVTPKSEADEFIDDFKDKNFDLNLQMTIILLILSFFTLIGIIIIGLWLSNRITRPIRKLSNVALQITQNVTEKDSLKGINVDDSIDQTDEIGDLTRSFDKMIEFLKKDKKN
jgi:HAMP domain-containing protein